MPNYDCLVIGSGIAGLSYALKVSEKLPWATVALITKSDRRESNTKYAQGGIAVVTDLKSDSFEKHFQDTLKAGAGLSDPAIVKQVVEKGPVRLSELINWEVDFDKRNTVDFELGLEGGHTQNRILHHKDKTGLEIERKLIERVKGSKHIHHFTNYLAIDLIADKNLKTPSKDKNAATCYGAYLLNLKTNKVETFVAQRTLLATGGIGQVYKNTTNPAIATGDGIALALRQNAEVKDMEFIQFHPTALYHPDKNPLFLISEAVRGFGAKLRTKAGELFLHNYDPREELASRDIISRAIYSELQKSGDEHVYLDCRYLDAKQFKTTFPVITETLANLNLDPAKDLIPVVPAAHYLCGGITTNCVGLTSVKNLFASGECARTGLHGANRLASNSLLEAIVFSHESAIYSTQNLVQNGITPEVLDWTTPQNMGHFIKKDIQKILKNVQVIMNTYGSISRSIKGLSVALNLLDTIQLDVEERYRQNALSIEIIELRNVIVIAKEIVKHSMQRTQSIGGFYKTDKH